MGRPIDRHGVDQLVVEHLPMALRMALRLARDPDLAEDMVQETLCRVLRQWKSYRGEASFRTWLLQILMNVDRDRRRRLHIHEPLETNEPKDGAGQPDDLAAAAEMNEGIRAAVDGLPQRQREVALLAWGEGLTAGEIASLLELTEANVYANLHLARKRIAQAIGVNKPRAERT